MKLATKHTTTPKQPTPARILTGADLARATGGDAYLHNPRGSNDRIDNP